MNEDLFWHADDFVDTSLGLSPELLSPGAPDRFYDYCAAKTPEAAKLPITYWSKERICAYVQISLGNEVAAIVSRMKLEDLRVFALRHIGKAQTGDWREFHIHKGKWRATEFFSLDMDNLRTLEASA